ncbi:glycosyltransferase [Terasakiella pusilla]|uniref:glycosyltransferase n=1 Tax=Terasakiella pusilla TaxID=64973 RepID=UPI003AA968F6
MKPAPTDQKKIVESQHLDDLLSQAQHASAQQDWQTSVTLWQHLSDHFFSNTTYALHWSLAAQHLEDHDSVIAACNRILEIDPTYKTALFRKAVALEKSTSPANAIRAWHAAARHLPDQVTPFIKIAQIFKRNDRPSSAARFLLKALKHSPDDQKVRKLALSYLIAEQHYPDLCRLWLDLIQNNAPDSQVPSNALLKTLEEKAMYEELHVLCEYTLGINPDNPTAQRLARFCYFKLDMRDKIEEHLISQLKKNPEDQSSRLRLVVFYEAHEQWEKASTAFKIIADNTYADSAQLRRYLKLVQKAGQVDETAHTLLRLTQQQPEKVDNWIKRYQHYRDLNDPSHATVCLSQALRYHPDNAVLLTYHARQHSSQADWDKAYEAFSKLATLADTAKPLLLAIRCLIHLEEYDEAIKQTRAALSRFPKSKEAHRRLTWLYRKKKSFAEAEAAAKNWVLFDRENVQAWDNWIDALLQLEKADTANLAFNQLRAHVAHTPKNLCLFANICLRLDLGETAHTHMTEALAQHGHIDVVNLLLKYGRIGEAYPILTSAPLGEAVFNEKEKLDEIFKRLNIHPPCADPTSLLLPEATIEALVRHAPDPKSDYQGVCLVTRSLAAGGAERQVAVTLRGLHDHGLSPLSLICAQSSMTDFYGPLLQGLDVTIAHPKTEDHLQHETAAIAGLLQDLPLSFQRQVVGHLDLFQKIKPHTVHIWQDTLNIAAGLASVLAGVPNIVLAARTQPPTHPIAKLKSPRYLQRGYQALLRLPHVKFCANSRAGADAYADWLGMPPEEASVIYNGLDFDTLNILRDESDPDPNQLPSGVPIVGTVFRFVWQKQPHLWINSAFKVAAEHQTCHFLMVGDGPLKPEIEDKITASPFKDRFHLVGKVHAVSPWFDKMDLFLMTSVVEGLPNVTIEAQAHGVPVVSTDAGGCLETFEQAKSGWGISLSKQSDVSDTLDHCAEDISNRILWTLSNLEWCKSAQRHAKNYVKEKFSIQKMITDTLHIYEAHTQKSTKAQT